MADDAELVRYCYRVASTVGLMMCAVLGVRRREALPHAVDLGIAMQLTNICRDVAEDAANGRVYLPADRLARAGVNSEDLVRGRASAAGVAEVVRGTLEMADRYIGVRLRRRRCDALGGRTVVPWPEKLYWGTRAMAEALRPGMRGVTPRWAHDATLHAALRGLPGANA
jgi:phytoene synthase